MNTSQLESLQPYLTRIAWTIRSHYPDQVPDDILQEMNLHILERDARDPTFLEQKPGYVTRAAAWHARTWCRDQYSSRFSPLEESAFPIAPRDVDLSLDVRDVMTTLSDKATEIAWLLAAGYKGRDLEAATGMSKQAINYHRQQLKQALAFTMA